MIACMLVTIALLGFIYLYIQHMYDECNCPDYDKKQDASDVSIQEEEEEETNPETDPQATDEGNPRYDLDGDRKERNETDLARNLQPNLRLIRESERLATFANWRSSSASSRDLAELGFFHLGDNKIKCIFCGLEIPSLDESTDPYNLHLELRPNCPFLGGRDVQNQPMDDGLAEWKNRRFTPIAFFTQGAAWRPFTDCDRKFCFVASIHRPSTGTSTLLIKKLHEAGFMCCHEADRIMCVRCKLNVIDWNVDSDLQSIHAQFSPKCPKIRLLAESSERRYSIECKVCKKVDKVMVVTMNCEHCVMCETCVAATKKCPVCDRLILRTVRMQRIETPPSTLATLV